MKARPKRAPKRACSNPIHLMRELADRIGRVSRQARRELKHAHALIGELQR